MRIRIRILEVKNEGGSEILEGIVITPMVGHLYHFRDAYYRYHSRPVNERLWKLQGPPAQPVPGAGNVLFLTNFSIETNRIDFIN